MAPRADEGRGETAKSLGQLSGKLSRGFPNGATHPDKIGILLAQHIGQVEVSGGTETSKYPEEKTNIPLVVANERGTAQTLLTQWLRGLCQRGVVRHGVEGLEPFREVTNHNLSRRSLERATIDGESPVG